MIQIEPCRGCGRPLIQHRVANLDVRLETVRLDGSAAVAEIVAQRTLWMVDAQTGRVRRARPGEPGPLREHQCTIRGTEKLSRAPQAPVQSSTSPGVPANPPVRPQAGSRPSSGQRTPSSTPGSARTVPTRDSDPLCDTCRKPVVLDGPELYTSIELGASVVWAVHETCPGR